MKSLKFVNKEIPTSLIKRSIAYLVDIFILQFIILYPITSKIKVSNVNNFTSFINEIVNKEFLVLSLIVIIITLSYFVLLEYLLKQTVGKIIMNIYVKSLIGELSFQQVLLRNITKPFSLILLVDILYMLFKKGNQRLFEVFSGTIVVQNGVIIK